MEIILDKKPKSPKIIEGFPGFGLIGTITTEFLIEHLNAELIGSFVYDDLPATVAIHKEKLVNPMGVFYNKKHNLMLLHTILNPVGHEWKVADSILKMAKELNAKEIISIEGVSSPEVKESKNVFHYSNKEKIKLPENTLPLKESIIMGVTGAILLRTTIPITCFFAETHSELPDSRAGSNIIKVLDKYLGLEVDYKPLLKQADQFEKKVKTILKQSALTSQHRDKKQMSYLG